VGRRVWVAQCVLAMLCLLLVGCQTSIFRQATPTPASTPPAATPAPTTPTSTSPAPASTSPTSAATPAASPTAQPLTPASPVPAASPTVARPASPVACQYGDTRKLAQVQDRDLKEASALAASSRYPGVYWTLNDSGNTPVVYALDEQGKSRGTFKVEDADNVDWEAIQVGPGKGGGTALYIGDIGDNDEKRKEIQIYRVPEPEVGPAGGRAPNGKTAPAELFKLSYPDGAHDAEAMLVHPTTGEILIVTKEVPGRATVYRVPTPLDNRRTTKLEQVTKLDLARAGVKTDVVDDATISPDARRVTIRTYGSGLEYDVPVGAQLASIWGQTPRLFKIQDPPQGEGISYRLDSSALLTIGEDSPTYLWLIPRQC
jgi:hypothetical protein